MKTFLSTCILVIGLTLVGAAANAFDIPVSPAWTKVQDGKVTQWSVIPPGTMPLTRIDLISYVEDGTRTTYYLVRRACANGDVEVYKIEAGKVIGVGLDCQRNMAAVDLPTVLRRTDELPAEATALLPKK